MRDCKEEGNMKKEKPQEGLDACIEKIRTGGLPPEVVRKELRKAEKEYSKEVSHLVALMQLLEEPERIKKLLADEGSDAEK